jgi:small multidrug resistance pump
VIAPLFMVGAVLAQALCLPATRASLGLRRPGWVLVAFAAMGLSVALMARALALGVPLAVGYGIWSGCGIVTAAASGVLVFHDRLARVHVAGLALVVAGVVLIYGG